MNVDAAYAECLRRARAHYENFPVASLLLPSVMRPHVAAIYAFARTADDVADEPGLTEAQRLAQLAAYRAQLDACAAGAPSDDPVFVALGASIAQHALPVEWLDDLLRAFIQDVTTRRYATYDDMLRYCAWSANPIGRLLLKLFDVTSAEALRYSDAICSALQQINFWQDLAQDVDENDRIYVPEEDLQRFGVSIDDLRQHRATPELQACMAFQYQRSRALLLQGVPLLALTPARLRWQLDVTLRGGLYVIDTLAASGGKVFTRPRVPRWLWLTFALRAAMRAPIT